MRFKTHTLGCKVNQYETQAMEEILSAQGYTRAGDEEAADIYIINTCTVTALADSKSRQYIQRSHRENPEALVVAVGCYVQVKPEEVAALPGVDVLIGTKDRHRLVELIEKAKTEGVQNIVENIQNYKQFDGLDIEEANEHTRAYIKIQDGCDRYCSYCKIPYARGPVRSRTLEDIIHEAKRLGQRGYKELVLTGIHVASYGRDLGKDLKDVILEVAKIPEIKRIRTSSMDPMWIHRERLQEISQSGKLCDHFHLSLQSGSNAVLKNMRRPYTREQFLAKVHIIREFFPNVGLTTDLIAGFPGERQEDFEDSLKIIGEAGFARVHVFPYSDREGTAAEKMKNKIPKKIKQERAKRLREESARIQQREEEKMLGKTLDVLIEESFLEEEVSYGYATNYFRVKILQKKMLENQIRRVKIKSIEGSILVGKEEE